MDIKKLTLSSSARNLSFFILSPIKISLIVTVCFSHALILQYSHPHVHARSVVVTVVKKMDTENGVQIVDESFYISHCGNTFGKDMNPTILPPAESK